MELQVNVIQGERVVSDRAQGDKRQMEETRLAESTLKTDEYTHRLKEN